jgi:hypothetical protein
MSPDLRKFVLTAHITVSVGWLGAVVAYLALAVAALTTQDAQLMRAAYLSMELMGWGVIVSLSMLALLTGLIQSLGTEWGLFRHYWILTKFVLTVGGIIVLLNHMPTVSQVARMAADSIIVGGDMSHLRIGLVVHAAGGLLVLLATTTLSVYRPWGMTAYGRRKLRERRSLS